MKTGEVAVVGRPNAGKSTLVNRLVGEKIAIVSDKPQTTRKRVLGVARREELEVALVDTPGIHRPEYRMNAAMVRDAADALATADLVLWVIDSSEKGGRGEAFILDLIRRADAPAVVALNKIDLVRKDRLLPRIAQLAESYPFQEIVPVSATAGEGVERLLEAVARHLPEGKPAYPDDFLTATPESEWAGEVIREKLLQRTRQELPFASAVVVESVRQDEAKNLTVVIASIVVEKDSQKAIVIGRGGSMIREIGRDAREELEAEFGRRFYLDLKVDVRARWRDDEKFLSRIISRPE